jgi:hypothetical protein
VRRASFVLATIGGIGATAHGNPAGDVADQSINGGVDYQYEADKSEVVRERVGLPGTDPDGPLPIRKDLAFKQFRHTITPHVEIGLVHDAFLTAALPIVITQARELHLDGIPRTDSSTLTDGIVPMGGYDARDPSTPPPGDLVFRGVSRHGLDQVHVGAGWAPMNQAKDDTKPTWKIGVEGRIAIGGVMKFDPANPKSNSAVGKGVHELRLWTSFDRRLGWAEPWCELFWQVPLAATSDSLFQDPKFGSTNTMLSQQAGASFGLEVYAVDNVADQTRISFDLGARAIAHFEGRDYSEMWEPFALAGSGLLQLDADPTTSGVQALNHPGISNIENYLETAARIALRAQLGPHVRFAALGDFIWKTDHVISFADAGVDRDASDKIEPGTAEVNPLYNQQIDLVGHRYRSVHNFGFALGIQGQVLF